MKKLLSVVAIILIVACLLILTGCATKEEVVENEVTEAEEENVVIEQKIPTVIDRTNSKLQKEEDIKKEIEAATGRYLEMVYGEQITDTRYGDIMIYKGDEDDMVYVDLAENDYAFQIDYEIKPASEKDAEEITEFIGDYDKESGWITVKCGYGVMRYNEISDEYDVTSITPDSF